MCLAYKRMRGRQVGGGTVSEWPRARRGHFELAAAAAPALACLKRVAREEGQRRLGGGGEFTMQAVAGRRRRAGQAPRWARYPADRSRRARPPAHWRPLARVVGGGGGNSGLRARPLARVGPSWPGEMVGRVCESAANSAGGQKLSERKWRAIRRPGKMITLAQQRGRAAATAYSSILCALAGRARAHTHLAAAALEAS